MLQLYLSCMRSTAQQLWVASRAQSRAEAHTYKYTERERQAHAHTRVPEMPELVTVATMLHSLLGPSSSTCL